MRSVLVAALVAMFAGAAQARPVEVTRQLPEAAQVGGARYDVLGFSVFDAALWAEGGVFSWDAPFAVEINYLRGFSAQSLADRAIAEMAQRSGRARSTFEPMRAELTACFADVARGDRITGVSTSPDQAQFYFNGTQRCEIEWPGMRRQFFSIWLDRRGGERVFSRQLLGAARAAP